MIKVLVVAENRHFVKNICNSFEGYRDISLELVYHSTNAFHTFISAKPDIVIIHSQIMLPIHSLLAEFAQCKWPYQVLILGTVWDPGKWKNSDITFLDDTDICRLGEIALSCKKEISPSAEAITEENTYRRQDYIIKPELYYIILSKYVGTDMVVTKEKIDRLNQCIEMIGTPEIFTVCGQDFIVVFKKADIRVSNALTKIHDVICHCVHPDYSSIYAQKVYWNQVNITCKKLLDHVRYTYFLCGECRDVDSLDKKVCLSLFETTYQHISNLLLYTLKGNQEERKNLMKQLYLHDIKEGFDFTALSALREGIQFGECLFAPILGRTCSNIKSDGNSVEYEYEKIDQYLSNQSNQLSLMKLSPIVMESIIYSFKHYPDELSLEKMADILCISKMHLSRLFKSQTNMTFLEFLQSLRIFVAKQYLYENIHRINEIAELTGYTDAHYFTKLFRKHVGCTPKDFRAIHIGRSIDESIN